MFEEVYTVWEYYDGPRTGIANFKGELHYFECGWDEALDDYSEMYTLRSIDKEILPLVDELDQIWKDWVTRLHKGEVDAITHPGYKNHNPRFGQLSDLLDKKMKTGDPVAKCRATFQASSGQDNLPQGVPRRIEVKWNLVA